MIREIDTIKIEQAVKSLSISANKVLPSSLVCAIKNAQTSEENTLAKSILADLESNLEEAKNLNIPICQDTGMAVVFLEIGQDVHLVGKPLRDAVNEGVRQGYLEGLLRKSVVGDPLLRQNTGDNTPAVIHTEIVPGNKVKVTVAPKGFGSENMSRVYMLTPAATRETIIEKVVETVRLGGGNPCPPLVIGVGIGGDFELAPLLSKKALIRPVDKSNPNEFYEKLENDCLKAVNNLNVGPQGFGGNTTALKVAIEQYPTHIAGLPLAINIGCHVTRHEITII